MYIVQPATYAAPPVPSPLPPPQTSTEASPAVTAVACRLSVQEGAHERLVKVVHDQQTTIDHLHKRIEVLSKDVAMLTKSFAALAASVAVDRNEHVQGFSAPNEEEYMS